MHKRGRMTDNERVIENGRVRERGRQMETERDMSWVARAWNINWITVCLVCLQLLWTLHSGETGVPGSFSTSSERIVKWRHYRFLTVVTALTSDTSHKWSCCCLQVDGQPSRLLCTHTPFSNSSARNSHFPFSLHAARNPFQEQEMINFLCVKYVCYAFGNFQFTHCIGFLIATQATMQTSLHGGETVLILEFKRQEMCRILSGM